MTTYRNSSVETLKSIATNLLAKGFKVGSIVIPENPWTHGNPYFSTNATNRDILQAHREAR